MAVGEHIIFFGNSSWTLSLAGSLAVVWFAGGKPYLALRWILSFGLGIVVIVGSRLAFDLYGWCLPSIGFFSISGHAMRTTAVYPVFFAVGGSIFGEREARAGLLFGLLMSLAMAVSLIVGNYHTLSETVAGTVIGLAVLWGNPVWRCKFRVNRLWLLTLIILTIFIPFPLVGHSQKLIDGGAIWEWMAHLLGAEVRYSRRIYYEPVNGSLRIDIVSRKIT